MISLDRRRLLATTLALWTGALPFSQVLASPTRNNSEKTVPWSKDSPAKIWLGQRYLLLHPEECSAERLAYLLSGRRFVNATEIFDCRELRQSVCQQRDEDFRSGNVVLIDGWVLARTEARLFALTAIESMS